MEIVMFVSGMIGGVLLYTALIIFSDWLSYKQVQVQIIFGIIKLSCL